MSDILKVVMYITLIPKIKTRSILRIIDHLALSVVNIKLLKNYWLIDYMILHVLVKYGEGGFEDV